MQESRTSRFAFFPQMAFKAALGGLLVAALSVFAPGVAHAANCTPGPGADLSGCDFANVNLTGANFTGANLDNANLSKANISAANFSSADLEGADLNQAVVTQFCPNQSPCPGIPFQFTSFSPPNADFTFASGPNFTDANLNDAKLRGVDLAGRDGVFLGTACNTVVFTTACYQLIGNFTDAVLTGVTSAGISGRPASIPAGWALKDGSLSMETGPLQITTSSLPSGELNVPYSAGLTAVGGNPPYKWSVIGSLPPGLRLDKSRGTISGRPRASGTVTFSVQVTDSKNGAKPPTQDTTPPLALSITIS
jgi:hypothetical protein